MRISSVLFIAILLAISIVFVVLWKNRKTEPLDIALKLSSSNRIELEKVLEHYKKKKADSTKLRAAHYLIENMHGHFSYDTTHLKDYRPVVEKINSLRVSGVSNDVIRERVNPLMDSLISIYPLSNVYSKIENDLTSIKSELLISTIEQAFESYNSNPFKDSILFDDFLEYVLPYRVHNGYCLEDWRLFFTRNYSPKAGQKFSNVHQLCESLLYNFKDAQFGWQVAPQFPYIKLDDYLKSLVTNCPQRCWFNCLLLRSFGIPVTVDFVPVARIHERGHEWNSFKMKEGFYPFESFWEDSMCYLKAFYGRTKLHPAIGPVQFPKIYRRTFKMNISELLHHSINSGEDIPPFFQNPFLKDVTAEYFKTFAIESPIINNIKDVDYAYACVMGFNQTWIPVDFGRIKKGKISFNSLGTENVYLPSFYQFGNTIPAAYPFLLNDGGIQSILCPDTLHTRKIEIPYVGYQRPELREYKEAFIGATVEGSNDKNFDKSEILYRVNKLCEPGTYYHPIISKYKYRYFRFAVLKNKIQLNEIKFFNKVNGIEKEVKGKLISSNPMDSLLFQKIVDRDLVTGIDLTSLSKKSKLSDKDKIWVGYDFKHPVSISAFEYYYVFNTSIRKEGIYELLYWDFGWKSLGIKKSNSTKSISFHKVPENALLMIKIHDTGYYSRIFTYSDGVQYWW
jgi:hypothetical protein